MKDAVVRPEKGRRTERQVLRGAGNSYPARWCETVASQELQKGIVRYVGETWTRRRKLVAASLFSPSLLVFSRGTFSSSIAIYPGRDR